MTEPTVHTVEHEFLTQQYVALRTEVEDANERAFKIFAASVLVVPTGLSIGAAAGNNVLPLIKMLLPLVLLAFYTMFVAQIFSTYRTGLYIQSHIEPKLLTQGQGWESWLSDRRYVYDAQVLGAFFLLSFVYYLGTVYLAVTAHVQANLALVSFTRFLNIANQRETVLLPDQVAEKLLYGWMLFIFYVLAAVLVFLLAQLIPKRELEEDRKMALIIDETIRAKPDHIQLRIEHLLKNTMKYSKRRSRQKSFFRQKCFEDRIKHSLSYKDSITGTDPAWHMRLTLRKASFKEAIRKDLLHRTVAFITGVGLLFWVYILLERIYYRLAHRPNAAIAWLLPPGPVQVFFVLALPLLAMLVVLAIFYHYNIGTKLGAKLTIKVLPLKDKPPDDPMTRCVVRTSLEDEPNKEAARNWVNSVMDGKSKDDSDRS